MTNKDLGKYAAGLRFQHEYYHPIPNHAPIFDKKGVCIGCTCRGTGWGCRPGVAKPSYGKHPRSKRWQTKTNLDYRRVAAEFWDIKGPCNIGVITGEAAGLLIIDVDAPEGLVSFEKLQSDLGPLPKAPTVKSGGGGLQIHLEYPGGVALKNSASALAPGIDIRGWHGQGLIPPSLHRSGKEYEWAVGPGKASPPFLPEKWLLALIKFHTKTPERAKPPAVDLSMMTDDLSMMTDDLSMMTDERRLQQLGRAFQVAEDLGPAISGHGGHSHTFKVACRVITKSLSEKDAWYVFVRWNTEVNGDDPWSEGELRHKFHDALNRVAIGEATIEAWKLRK